MAQHYFVVFFDDETNKWSVDYETLVARFPNGSVWFEEEDDLPAEWVDFYDMEPEEKNNARLISDGMRKLIEFFNKKGI